MKDQEITTFLEESINVMLHNFIYYIPVELIDDKVLEQLEGEIEEDFFDEISILDLHQGYGAIDNDDIVEISNRLTEKRSELEKNLFKLLELEKQIDSRAFDIIKEKYLEQLMYYATIALWLQSNLQMYFKDLHLGMIGMFGQQYQHLLKHYKEVSRYFENYVEIKNELDFSAISLVTNYIPQTIGRFAKAMQKIEETQQTKETKEIAIDTVNDHSITKEKKEKEVKLKPTIDEKALKISILKTIFKVSQQN